MIKWIGRYDATQRKFRVASLIWERGEWGMKTPEGRCIPYSFKMTLAFQPVLFRWRREYDQLRIAMAGISINYRRSAGGRFA